VIRLVAASFVPVALNLYKVRAAKDDAGKFFRAVQKQRPAQYQGVYIVSPAGKVLSSQGSEPAKPKSWTKDLLDVSNAGLKAFGKVAPRKVKVPNPLPFRGAGVRPDGSVSLAVYLRTMLLGMNRAGFGGVAIDTIPLSAKEFAALAPKKLKAGATWDVPVAVGRRLSRLLSPSSDQSGLARPEEVTAVTLTGKVESIKKGIAYLTYEGSIKGTHSYPFEPHKGKKTRGKAALEGVGACDVKTGRLLSFTLLGECAYRHFPPGDYWMKFRAVVEWQRKRSEGKR
jgi:hypothetical protein